MRMALNYKSFTTSFTAKTNDIETLTDINAHIVGAFFISNQSMYSPIIEDDTRHRRL